MPAKRKRPIKPAPEAKAVYDKVRKSRGLVGRPSKKGGNAAREQVIMLRADGWEVNDIADLLGMDPVTLQKHYGYEVKFGALIKRNELLALLNKKAKKGHAPSMKYLLERAEGALSSRASRKQAERLMQQSGLTAEQPKAADKKEPKKGKKELAVEAAHKPDENSSMGALMATRSRLTH